MQIFRFTIEINYVNNLFIISFIEPDRGGNNDGKSSNTYLHLQYICLPSAFVSYWPLICYRFISIFPEGRRFYPCFPDFFS